MLSNTAVPKYYGQFRDAVLRGEIPVNAEISMQMNRIDTLIDNPYVWYDDQAVEGYVKFCENELTLTDGSDMYLLPSFKLWAEDLFGWWYFVDRDVYVPGPNGAPGYYKRRRIRKRLINKQYIIVARGGAKTMYDSSVQGFYLTVDTTTTSQITVAPTMAQAEEVLTPLRTAIVRSRGPLFQFMTEGSLQNTTGSKINRQKLASTKKGIENFLTNSLLEVRPMRIDKLQGLRCKIATVDEWLSGETPEDPISAIEQSCSKSLDDYIIICTSSEGTVRNGVGDSIKMELMKILRGEYINPHVSIWYYKLDDVQEVANPRMWIKANPNLGATVTYETYQLDVERAEQNPSTRNDILAKRFGIPLEGYTYFFTYYETIPHPPIQFTNIPCAMGGDLSQGDDFCAFGFLFPFGDERFGFKARCYISRNNYNQLPPAAKIKYQEFINEGSLVILEGVHIDIDEVYEDLYLYIEQMGWDVEAFGYDPYNAEQFIKRWLQENSEFGVEMVRQGARTETVPLGEIKQLVNVNNRLLVFDQAIVQYAMGNAIVLEDTNGNRKLLKKRHEAKIDPVAALIDAWVAYKLHPDFFM